MSFIHHVIILIKLKSTLNLTITIFQHEYLSISIDIQNLGQVQTRQILEADSPLIDTQDHKLVHTHIGRVPHLHSMQRGISPSTIAGSIYM